MQAGRLLTKALEREAETGDDGLEDTLSGSGHCPANRRLARILARAVARREARSAASTCAAIAPRNERGRFK